MTLTPAAIATARRNVAHRIERFLKGLDLAGRPPDRRELHYLREALRKLEAAQYPEAEEAMLKAERLARLPEAAATAVPESETATEVLRAELRGSLHGGLT
jgi:hypothetical protein